jgi:hypothetical protein
MATSSRVATCGGTSALTQSMPIALKAFASAAVPTGQASKMRDPDAANRRTDVAQRAAERLAHGLLLAHRFS